jgi:hypothetical protein
VLGGALDAARMPDTTPRDFRTLANAMDPAIQGA